MLVSIPYHECYGCTGGDSVKQSGQEFHLILLLTACGNSTLSRAAALHELMYVIKVNRNP